jgi:hypothetical protein
MAKVGQSLIDFDPSYLLCTGEVSALLHSRFSAARIAPFRSHSDLTCVFVMCLIILSGSRAIHKYLSRLSHQINYDLSLVFPMDKEISDGHSYRIAVLPSCVAPMLIEYALHLKRLVHCLMEMGEFVLASKFQALLDPDTSYDAQPIDYFSRIDSNMNSQCVELQDIRLVLGPRWPIRLCETRGQYSRYMKCAGAPEFLIRQQRGHQSKAYPFHGIHNQYSLYELRREFVPYADRYATEVGIWPCK